MACVTHYKELWVYEQSFSAAMRLFELSKKWPSDERYFLIDQIRRSSRSVCGNIAEAWRKRRYPSHFVSILSDADAEVAETQNWLDFALACGYVAGDVHRQLWDTYEQVSRGLVGMMSHSETWCGLARLREGTVDYVIPPVE